MAKSSSRVQNTGQDFPPTNLDENKFFTRLQSKEKYNLSSSKGEASFRVSYYGNAARSVPFSWESQPGTPKHPLCESPPPPLTPPPSYKFSPQPSLQKKHSKNSKVFNSIFLRNPSKKVVNDSPSFSPSSSFSSSDSLKNGRNISPTSTLMCFGPGKESSLKRSKGYFYPIKSVKKVVFSVVGGKVN